MTEPTHREASALALRVLLAEVRGASGPYGNATDDRQHALAEANRAGLMTDVVCEVARFAVHRDLGPTDQGERNLLRALMWCAVVDGEDPS